MKVSVVMPYFFPATVYGGPIFASYNLCKQAANQKLNVEVITTDANGSKRINTNPNQFQNLDNFKVKYCKEEIPNYFSFAFFIHLWRDLKDSDVVHIQSIYSYTTPIALFYACLQNKKTILSPRGSLAKWSFSKRGFLKKLWISILIRPFIKNTVWLATSEKERKEILYFFKKHSIKLLSDGVDIPSNFVLTKSKWSSQNYIAGLGRIHKVKGFDILIRAMKHLQDYDPNLKLLIAGNDEGDLNYLKKIVTQLELNKQVQFVGALHNEDKEQFLANANCLVLSSHTENFGIVAAEALSLGTPVVASKNTPWNILESYKAGLYVDNNANEIAKACITILENLEDYEKKTKLLAQQFDWKYIATQYLKMLKSI
jgi:glycosyltransferase involved in cell wall biosynthesis